MIMLYYTRLKFDGHMHVMRHFTSQNTIKNANEVSKRTDKQFVRMCFFMVNYFFKLPLILINRIVKICVCLDTWLTIVDCCFICNNEN